MRDRGSHNRSIQHRLIFSTSFAIYVLAGIGRRLFPAFWRKRQHRPLLAEAWAASDMIAQLAFAG